MDEREIKDECWENEIHETQKRERGAKCNVIFRRSDGIQIGTMKYLGIVINDKLQFKDNYD